MDAPRRLGEKLLELTALLDEPERAQGAEELVSRLLSKLRASERVRQLGADGEEEESVSGREGRTLGCGCARKRPSRCAAARATGAGRAKKDVALHSNDQDLVSESPPAGRSC